jgi:hypothetical protein
MRKKFLLLFIECHQKNQNGFLEGILTGRPSGQFSQARARRVADGGPRPRGCSEPAQGLGGVVEPDAAIAVEIGGGVGRLR